MSESGSRFLIHDVNLLRRILVIESWIKNHIDNGGEIPDLNGYIKDDGTVPMIANLNLSIEDPTENRHAVSKVYGEQTYVLKDGSTPDVEQLNLKIHSSEKRSLPPEGDISLFYENGLCILENADASVVVNINQEINMVNERTIENKNSIGDMSILDGYIPRGSDLASYVHHCWKDILTMWSDCTELMNDKFKVGDISVLETMNIEDKTVCNYVAYNRNDVLTLWDDKFKVGAVGELETEDKTTIVSAVNELFNKPTVFQRQFLMMRSKTQLPLPNKTTVMMKDWEIDFNDCDGSIIDAYPQYIKIKKNCVIKVECQLRIDCNDYSCQPVRAWITKTLNLNEYGTFEGYTMQNTGNNSSTRYGILNFSSTFVCNNVPEMIYLCGYTKCETDNNTMGWTDDEYSSRMNVTIEKLL